MPHGLTSSSYHDTIIIIYHQSEIKLKLTIRKHLYVFGITNSSVYKWIKGLLHKLYVQKSMYKFEN